MKGPSGTLKTSCQNLVDDFNNVPNTGAATYDAWGNAYLYSSNGLIVQKVDDPGEFVVGNPNDIISYLNSSQIPSFPQLTITNPNPQQHGSKHSVMVGDVTGNGTYYDTLTDFTNGNGMSVHYTFRFKMDYTSSNWLLCTALVVPR